MRKAIVLSLCVMFLSASIGGCYAFTHTVGNGGTGQTSVSAKRWYFLYGLVPLNSVNGGQMAAGATDYTIHTEYSVVDFLISIVTSIVTVYPMTCTVTK